MRGGWNNTLERRIARNKLSLMQRVVVVEQEDVKKLKSDWDAADSKAGFVTTDEGRVLLLGTETTLLNQNDHTGDAMSNELKNIATYDFSSSVDIALIKWAGNEDIGFTIPNLKAYLIDQADGGQPKEVTRYRCQMFGVMRAASSSGPNYIEISPLHHPIEVPATGGTSGVEYTFNFNRRPMPKRFGIPGTVADGDPVWTSPVTIVVIWGLDDNGDAVGNTAWEHNGSGSYSSGNNVVEHWAVTDKVDHGDLSGFFEVSGAPGAPYLIVTKNAYTETTLAFTGAGNRLEFDTTPTGDIELLTKDETPSNTSITYEISSDNSTWYEFLDGDIVGDDNTGFGGSNLTGLAVQSFYYVRATLTPSSPIADTSPVLIEMGMRERQYDDITDIATLKSVEWRVDPVSLEAPITEAVFNVNKDGPDDGRDLWSEVLAKYNIGDIEIHTYVGHPDLDRNVWMLIDEFLVEDYKAFDNYFEVLTTTTQSLLTESIPPFESGERSVLDYGGNTLKAAYDDILGTQMAVSSRYIGPGIEDDTTTVTKRIEEVRKGKEELDALAFIAGRSLISSQGRIKAVDMFQDSEVRAFFDYDEVKVVSMTPGYRYAQPEYFIEYSWDYDEGRFLSEVRSTHGSSLTKISRGRIEAPERTPQRVSRWVDDQTLAETLASRVVTYNGPGVIMWRLRSTRRRPFLEPGDIVVVPTTKFVARDPNTDKELRGMLWARAAVVGVHDPWGQDLTLWVRQFSDIISSEEVITYQPLTWSGSVVFDDGTAVTTWTPDFSTGSIQLVELTGDTAIANPDNAKAGHSYLIKVKQDSTGGHNITSWGSRYLFPGGAAPNHSTGAGEEDVITLIGLDIGGVVHLYSVMQFAFAAT